MLISPLFTVCQHVIAVHVKKNYFLYLVHFVILMPPTALVAEISSEVIILQADNFEHIEFRRIKHSQYSFRNQQLRAEVNNSASLFMQAFDTERQINRVSFEWRGEGEPQIKNSQHEEKRQGDDAVFKLGLLLKAGDSLPNPFLPSWMKRVEKLLKLPSENMIYLIVNAKHAVGKKWLNPYNKRVTISQSIA